jgi:hypothetical protein
MPTDILLPAFLLTLVANAALVAVAIRGLARSRADRDRATRWIEQPRPPAARPDPSPSRAPRAEPAPPVDPTPAERPSAEVAPARSSRAAESTVPTGGPETPTSPPRRPRPAARTPGPRPSPSGGTAPKTGRSTKPRADGPKAGRRRFSLPPLDDDHERVSRSIQSFLSGADGPDGTDAGSVLAGTAGPTTIAVVAIHGIDPASTARMSSDRTVGDAIDAAVATVDRTLRSAARTADRVTAIAPGRFRIVLPATGELAARSYLRRVRATVDPILEAVDVPLVLVTATTPVLDESEDAAAARADARLDAALAALTRDAADVEPRAAGD